MSSSVHRGLAMMSGVASESVTRSIWVPVAAAALFVSCLATARLVPLFDPDEGYYPAAAAESLDSGDAWDLRLNGAPRWDKPVLTYALIQGAFVVGGRSPAVARCAERGWRARRSSSSLASS